MPSPERINLVARNEARFREINATLEDGLAKIDLEEGEPVAFVCECGNADCHQLVPIPLGRYVQAREHSDHFVVMPGHEIRGVERVADRGDTWLVVEKLDRADALDIVRGS
jgi:hypothetical protein